jgi:hypothetical protein
MTTSKTESQFTNWCGKIVAGGFRHTHVKRFLPTILAACALVAHTQADEPAKHLAVPPGLYVQNGLLLKGGQPYRGVGANYLSLFSRLLVNPHDTSGFSNLTALARAQIPFVRFMCGGFWPNDHQLYLTNRPDYFVRLDRVVRCAETNGIGLIPSLFWQLALVPDLVGEPVSELGNPQSKTIAFIRRYTEEVVTRYKDSPAIWGWEFGNEYDMACDLPDDWKWGGGPAVAPQMGTPAHRTARDKLTFAHLRVAFAAFTETVRRFDRTRLLISGNNMPFNGAWHNAHEKNWNTDSPAQFSEILLRNNPDPLDVISVHLYPDARKVYVGGTHSYRAAVALAQHYARQAGKPLFLGEFGVATDQLPVEQHRAAFTEMLAAIEQEDVPLAAFWVYDLPYQKNCNITFTNDRAWMLDAVIHLNSRLRKESKSGPP